MRRFALNIAQKRLGAGLRQDPLGEVTALPRSSSWIKGEGKGQGRELSPPFKFSGYAMFCSKKASKR